MDIVRRVFHGGKRVVDTTTDTVLQRALLPNDAHAFVKVYDGDVDSYTPYNYDTISMCNVTLGSGQINALDEIANPPLLRVADGDFSLWSTTENVQCMYQGEAGDSGKENRPVTGDDLIVRVQSCVDGQDANVAASTSTADYCKPYGATPVYKPVGVLQENSEDGSIRFGLMTGSHGQKMSGGILRRKITALAGNDDPANDEVDLDTGRFSYIYDPTNFSGGIIQTLDSMRIGGWDYGDGSYADYGDGKYADCGDPGIKVPKYKAENDICKDWGNPSCRDVYGGAALFCRQW